MSSTNRKTGCPCKKTRLFNVAVRIENVFLLCKCHKLALVGQPAVPTCGHKTCNLHALVLWCDRLFYALCTSKVNRNIFSFFFSFLFSFTYRIREEKIVWNIVMFEKTCKFVSIIFSADSSIWYTPFMYSVNYRAFVARFWVGYAALFKRQ